MVLLLNFFFDVYYIYKIEVDFINIFDEIKIMFLYKLYSVCVSILIVENLFDLIKFFFFLL